MGMVAAKLLWHDRRPGGGGASCPIDLDAHDLAECTGVDVIALLCGEIVPLEPDQVARLNAHVPVIIDVERYSYAIVVPEDRAPFGC